jgi:hypothetical protein
MTTLRRVLPLLLLLLVASVALATTLTPEERFCPVCGVPVTVQLPTSTNDSGGQDRDLLRRAHGAQVFMEVVASCGSCGFTGWPADFDETKRRKHRGKGGAEDDGAALTDAQRQVILEGGLVRPAALEDVPSEPDAPFANLPSWARLDLLAQTVALRGGSAERVADLHLQAAWAVRMGYHPVHLEGAGPTEAQREWLFGRLADYTEQAAELAMSNPADVEIWAGIRLLATAEHAPGELGCLSATYGASLMRSHGEHQALLAALPMLEGCFEATSWSGKAQAIRDSVALEQHYQRLARDGFAAALAAGSMPAEDAALTTYLVGEIERRIGETEAARGHFDAALAMGGPAGLELWIRQQRCLLDQEDPILGLLMCRAEEPANAAPPPGADQPESADEPPEPAPAP